ncbi:hypothetical protein Tc00.1047053508455.30 [Trypanosoma cruzi]|uniref:Uncharacterized protein n=1 Tax=Trypanosoma cruzi (strain CL Brener) TaxID=353153 RepID=Q4CWC4_TRYCC|nr:hypothetical protein Tc00.1047053508455.30 [Trypanosoma cruzi]EAN84577.1 hypothetical protein Tc00.1047053508455.30 [Trypanosoma cruzi]|eukprot:XP_806428.1 hypothetical protein [Trypanosoma cruzi strain CL Brener]
MRAVRSTRAALQRHDGVTPRGEHRCRPACHVQEELLLPLSKKENGLSSTMMRGRPHLLAAPATSADKKMQTTLCCTHDGRCTRRNSNRILWHHTPQWMCTVSVSLPPVPLPENSSVAVAHSPTCQKALVLLPPSHFEQQHHQTHVAPPFADSPQTRLPPHSSAHRHAVRKRHAAAPHDGAAHTNRAPRHSAQAVSGHTKQVAPANNSPLQAVRQDSSVTIKKSAPRLLLPPCTRFCLPHASSVTPGPSMSEKNAMLPSTQREAH